MDEKYLSATGSLLFESIESDLAVVFEVEVVMSGQHARVVLHRCGILSTNRKGCRIGSTHTLHAELIKVANWSIIVMMDTVLASMVVVRARVAVDG